MKKILYSILFTILLLTGCKPSEPVLKDNLTKHNTGILIKYEENIIFNKYDIDLLVDEEKIGSISQGEDKLYQLELTEGSHVISVKEQNTKNNIQNINIDITKSECFSFISEAKWEGITLSEQERLSIEEAKNKFDKNKDVISIVSNDEIAIPDLENETIKQLEIEENSYLNLLNENQDDFAILTTLALETYYTRFLSEEQYNDLLNNNSNILSLLEDIYDYSDQNNYQLNTDFQSAFNVFWTDSNKIKYLEIDKLLDSWTLEYSLLSDSWILNPNPENRKYDLTVHYIDVGQGDSVLIESEGHFMLIDAGERNMSSTVIKYLNNQGVQKLDYIIATHPHSDHIGGLIYIIDEFQIEKILMPDVIHTSQTFEELLDTILENELKITKPVFGNEHKLGSSVFTIIAPNNDYYDNLNNYSVGIKLTNGVNSFVFAGDAEITSEKEILNNGINIDADVLYLNHHGSATASHDKYLDTISPAYAIISAGLGNQYGHPHVEIMQSLLEKDINVYRTDKQGTIVFTSDGKDISVNKDPYDIINDDLSNNQSTDNEANEIFVHITNTGSKYHRAGCRYLKSNIKVTLSEARNKGLSPCKVCSPPTK